jgi:hypothetical protein
MRVGNFFRDALPIDYATPANARSPTCRGEFGVAMSKVLYDPRY